eukprot:Amastigsp_a250_252.p4 type:complete len:122 gc:universal Amastigsp_a250_252:250-615(+)
MRVDDLQHRCDGRAPTLESPRDLSPVAVVELARGCAHNIHDLCELVHGELGQIGGEHEQNPRLDIGLGDGERCGDCVVRDLVGRSGERREREQPNLARGLCVVEPEALHVTLMRSLEGDVV